MISDLVLPNPDTLEDAALARADAYENGVHSAQRGEQCVIVHPDCDLEGAPEGLHEAEAFVRIVFHIECGDPNVGIPGWSSWVLAADQKGTGIDWLLNRYTLLEGALEDLLGQFDQAHSALGVDRSPSAQEAIANARQILAPIQRNYVLPPINQDPDAQHVEFRGRTQTMHCNHCAEETALTLPSTLQSVAQRLEEFNGAHKDCKLSPVAIGVPK